jgi:hypothetical protein
VQFSAIIVHEVRKIGMEIEIFSIIVPTISTAYVDFSLEAHPFS